MLSEFITLHRNDIIARCRAKVAQRSIPAPSMAEIDHGVPLFLEQLVTALRPGTHDTMQIDLSAGLHGHDLLLQGLTVSQVVHDYGDVCQAITDLAVETNAPISTDDFRMLNRCLDEAIASAVTTYQRGRVAPGAPLAATRGPDRVYLLLHELRSVLSSAVVAFDILKTGNVGVSGSTGSVLNRSLVGSRELINRAIDEALLASGEVNKRPTAVSEFVQGIAAAAAAEAAAQGVTLHVPPVRDGLTFEVDRTILTAVIHHLLQNAFKFTKPHSTVTLSVTSGADRIRIEVEDECGGLHGPDAMKIPYSLTPSGAASPGLGIGLAFCRSGAEVNGGRLDIRNRANGCVHTVDLPRSPAPDYHPAAVA